MITINHCQNKCELSEIIEIKITLKENSSIDFKFKFELPAEKNIWYNVCYIDDILIPYLNDLKNGDFVESIYPIELEITIDVNLSRGSKIQTVKQTINYKTSRT